TVARVASASRAGKARVADLADDLGVQGGRHRQVEEAVPRGSPIPIDPLELLGQRRPRRGVVELAALVLDARAERLPDGSLQWPVAAVLVDPGPQVGTELVGAEV